MFIMVSESDAFQDLSPENTQEMGPRKPSSMIQVSYTSQYIVTTTARSIPVDNSAQ